MNNNEYARIWKETFVIYFKVLFRHFNRVIKDLFILELLNSALQVHKLLYSVETKRSGVFWVVTPYSEGGGSMDLCNVDILPQLYTASRRTRPGLETSVL